LERILIVGSPGAGKSTLARALGKKTGLPVYHIDNIYHYASGESITRDELRERLLPILESDRWIIDGNYSATFEYRLQYATTVILLDVGLEVCESGIRERVGKPRPDMPFFETEVPSHILEAARRYSAEILPKMLETLKRYPRVKLLHFNSREKAYSYLQLNEFGG